MKKSNRIEENGKGARGAAQSKKTRSRASKSPARQKPAKAKKACPRHLCEIKYHPSRVEFRALTMLAHEWGGPLALECEAAYLLLRVAMANVHILKPHLRSMASYCEREGIDQGVYLEKMIAAQFRLAKGAR